MRIRFCLSVLAVYTSAWFLPYVAPNGASEEARKEEAPSMTARAEVKYVDEAGLDKPFADSVVAHCRRPDIPTEPDPTGQDAGGPSSAMIHVAYASDRLEGVVPSAISVASRLQASERCTIHWVIAESMHTGELEECYRERYLEGLRREPPPPLIFHGAKPLRFDTRGFNDRLFPYATKPLTYARLYLHEYLPAAPRVLWLDDDTVALSSIAPLYRVHMRGNPIAARQDAGIMGTAAYYYSVDPALGAHLGPPETPTFGSGVAVLNLDRWRAGAVDLHQVARRVVQLHGSWGEQLALNLVLAGRWEPLSWYWNVDGICTTSLPVSCLAGARILHFSAGALKPWQNGSECITKGLYPKLMTPCSQERKS